MDPLGHRLQPGRRAAVRLGRDGEVVTDHVAAGSWTGMSRPTPSTCPTRCPRCWVRHRERR
jgi:hypothetical protein